MILFHDHADPAIGSHYDLLLARGRVLKAWRLPRALTGRERAPLVAAPLPDHRRRYLTHQGPIGGARGSVRRVVGGEYLTHHWAAGRIEVTLLAPDLRARYRLRRGAGRTWSVERLPAGGISRQS
ncbi:MAG: hypothetical protein HY719_04260 [Planctomycetes bacterium]|nr:hypothetical protein [Planctomycetota bacterium]